MEEEKQRSKGTGCVRRDQSRTPWAPGNRKKRRIRRGSPEVCGPATAFVSASSSRGKEPVFLRLWATKFVVSCRGGHIKLILRSLASHTFKDGISWKPWKSAPQRGLFVHQSKDHRHLEFLSTWRPLVSGCFWRSCQFPELHCQCWWSSSLL